MPGSTPYERGLSLIQGGGPFPGEELVFRHQGAMDHVMVGHFSAMVEEASREAGDPTLVRKRMVNVLMEAMENLCRHVDPAHQQSIRVVLVHTASAYRLLLCNITRQATAAVLVSRLEILNGMDDEALKNHHMVLLENEGRTEGGGAGLGLVTMARRSRRPMAACTYPVDGSHAWFCMELTVERKG